MTLPILLRIVLLGLLELIFPKISKHKYTVISYSVRYLIGYLNVLFFAFCSPVIGQNLFYAGMKYTSATFTAAMCNVLPALTFLMAWILRYKFSSTL